MLAGLVHAEEPDVLRPVAEPTSVVTLQLVRCDDIAAGGAVVTGRPELVLGVGGEQVPLTLADLDDLLERGAAARARMVAASAALLLERP